MYKFSVAIRKLQFFQIIEVKTNITYICHELLLLLKQHHLHENQFYKFPFHSTFLLSPKYLQVIESFKLMPF